MRERGLFPAEPPRRLGHGRANGEQGDSRRAFLRATLGVAGATVLAACGAGGTSTAPAGGGTTQATGSSLGGAPTNVEGKIPSPAPGVPDAYTKAPPPFKSYNGVPGRGGKVTAFTIAYQTPPPPRDQNQYWQELEKRLGVTWEPIITPQPDYGSKAAALIAGGSLPDLFYLNPGQNAAPEYKAMDQGAFLDLTPYVTGDALKEYKNLATFPDYMWNNVKFKNKIYGVPKPLQRNGNIPWYRGDWAQKVGKDNPKSIDDVHDLLVAFTKNDPDGNGQGDTWGMGRYGTDWTGWDNTLAFTTFGAPFNWRKNANGTMTNQIETDEFRQALDFLRRLFADGAYHPDAGGMTFAQAQAAFIGGKTGMHSEGIGNFYSPSITGTVYYKIKQAFPQAVLTGLMPNVPGGAKAVTRNTPGSFGYTGIPATAGKDKARVQELLRILDYMAAPFGSEEWTFLNYGVQGVDYQPNSNGVPVMTDKGISEKGDLVYLMAGLPVFFYPLAPDVAPTAQQLAAQIIKIGIDDPSWPLYSPTNVSKAAELNQFGFDSVTAIITGRQPLSAFDDAIKEWKSRGGDQIRQEFEQALKGS